MHRVTARKGGYVWRSGGAWAGPSWLATERSRLPRSFSLSHAALAARTTTGQARERDGTMQWGLSGTQKTSPISNGIPLPCGWVMSVAPGRNGPGQVRAFALPISARCLSPSPCCSVRTHAPRRAACPPGLGRGSTGPPSNLSRSTGSAGMLSGGKLEAPWQLTAESAFEELGASVRQRTNFRNTPLARISVGGSLVSVATTAAVWVPHFFAAFPAPYRTCRQEFEISAHRAN